jgi:hypothetical protein
MAQCHRCRAGQGDRLCRVYERSDSDVRGLEGLEPTTGWLHGEPPTGLSIDENGVQLASMSSAATRPASISTSATTVPGCAVSRPARKS